MSNVVVARSVAGASCVEETAGGPRGMDPAEHDLLAELRRARRSLRLQAMDEPPAFARLTPGQRIADAFATVLGSWSFIIVQSAILAVWITANLVSAIRAWDPYPFVLLNLALSFQSAYAAPILMISQNRQGKLAERRNHLDLQVNMLAEQETTEILRLLHLLCERSGIRLDADGSGRALEEETKYAEIVRQIQGEIEEHKREAAEVLEQVAAKDVPAPGDPDRPPLPRPTG